VSDDWELSSPPLTTPPFSTVQYKNGIRITVEPQKIEFVHVNPGNPNDSLVSTVVQKYINVVPLVRYNAIGINFVAAKDIENPIGTLQKAFLKTIPIAVKRLSLQEFSIKLQYKLSSAIFSVTYEIGKKNIKGKGIVPTGVIANSNFHEEINLNDLQNSVAGIISKKESYWDLFIKTISTQTHVE
jgi:hypothetical protein